MQSKQNLPCLLSASGTPQCGYQTLPGGAWLVTSVSAEPCSCLLMAYVRALVTLNLVGEQVGVQVMQGAQALAPASVPPCWQPYECFREAMWGLPVFRVWPNPALLQPCYFPLTTETLLLMVRGLGCGQADADIELPRGCLLFSPPSIERQVGLEQWGIQPSLSL